MDNKKLFGLMLVMFLIGDAEAIVRANMKHRRQIKKFNDEKIVADMKIKALCDLVNGYNSDDPMEDVMMKFNDARAFIDLIDREF